MDELIAKLRNRSFVLNAMPAVAQAVEGVLKGTAEAGTTPDGQAWAPRKDGQRALPDAADAIKVRAVGTVVLARVDGPYARHNNGTGHAPRRQILPSGGIPPGIAAAIRGALIEAWK